MLKAACEGRLVPTEAELARAEGREYEPADRLLERILAERRAAGGAKYKEPEPPTIDDLPPVPEGWTWVRWSQIGTTQNGRGFPSSEYQESGIKLVRPGNLDQSGRVSWNARNTKCLDERWANEFPAFLVGPRELLMNLTAQSLRDEFLGRVCLTGESERCLLNQRIARLRPIHVLPAFILWLLKSQIFRRFVDSLNTGSLIQHMFTHQLDEFVFPLPPLAEQERIVAEVERRLSVIEKAEAAVAANLKRAERMRQAILKRAFEGKLVPQDPNDESASVLLDRIRAEREQSAVTAPKRRGHRSAASAIKGPDRRNGQLPLLDSEPAGRR